MWGKISERPKIRWRQPAAEKYHVILDAHQGGVDGFMKVSLVSGIDNPCISCILDDEPFTINP